MVEIYPFTKITWRSPKIRDVWEPLRRRVSGAVNFAEYEMVKRGLRKCDVYDFGPRNILHRLKKVAKDELCFIPILISRTYGGYGHKHYVTDKFEDDTFIYGVVAKNIVDAIKFHDAGVVNVKDRMRKWNDINPNGIDHDITGELLGYPKCDRDFFRDVWLRDGCLDPMYEMALNTENYEYVSPSRVKVSGKPSLNRLCRYWGYNMIPHFPHSFDCVDSGIFAHKFIELMREKDEEATNACLEVLKMPMVWSLYNCIIEVQHPLFWGSANGYYRKEKIIVEWYPE
jgi:hypothetical protein